MHLNKQLLELQEEEWLRKEAAWKRGEVPPDTWREFTRRAIETIMHYVSGVEPFDLDQAKRKRSKHCKEGMRLGTISYDMKGYRVVDGNGDTVDIF